MPHDISLCFSIEEFKDVCTRFVNGRYSIDSGLRAYIHQITNGHPGLCLGLLESLKDRDSVRRVIKARGNLRLDDVTDFFDDDTAVMKCVCERVRRSLPTLDILRSSVFPNLSDALRQAIIESGIVANCLDDVPGLKSAYHLGLLQAEWMGDGNGTLYCFPSSLHER